MSTYNGERYLAEQLDSIFRQTWPNIEVLVRDDGSKDATLEILNCDIDFSDDAQGAFMHLCNHGQVLLKDVTIKHCRNDVLIKKWSDGGEIVCDNLNCIDFKGEIEKLTEEEFNCKWI